MVSIMTDKKLLDMANKVAGEFNSEEDFEEFTKALRKQFWESTLEGELDDHLKRVATAAEIAVTASPVSVSTANTASLK